MGADVYGSKVVFGVLDIGYLLLFVALAGAVLWASRSLATGVINLSFGVALTGLGLALWGIPDWTWTYRALQAWLALGLAATAAYAWLTGRTTPSAWPLRRALIVLAPIGALALVFLTTRLMATDAGGPLAGVGYLINRPGAEDNAKWLNATSQLASGGDVLSQETAVGAPLLMIMVAVATVISVASTLLYGGVNQVAVAADTLILTQHLLVIASPLALAPLAAATWKLRRIRQLPPRPGPAGPEPSRTFQVPALALWLGMGVLAITSILLTRYGHLTLQYTVIVLVLWLTCFIALGTSRRNGLLATLTVVACSQVWFPLSVLAAALLVTCIAWIATAAIRALRDRRRPDWVAVTLTIVVGLLMAGYLASSIGFALGTGTEAALPLFSIGGGTEAVTPILLGLAAVGVWGTASLLSCVSIPAQGRWSGYIPVLPMIVLLGYAVAVTLVDFWATGEGPGYGSRKMLFGVTIAILVATIPVAVTRLGLSEPGAAVYRIVAVAGVVFLLIADTLIPRAIVDIRPQAWAVAGTEGYQHPAEVQPTGDQPLTSSPIGCVFLRGDTDVPSAFPWADSQNLGQRTYACTRLLVGMAGLERDARPIVDWLLNEWINGTSTWPESRPDLAALPAEVRSRTFIVLDPYARIVGTPSLDELLAQYTSGSINTAQRAK